ncbi:hypothetical protein C9928_06695 [Pseudidiomarina aestuarii]|uniref:Uncharacterized protein n=1 Tax=Pseudidiomarina aestuarii TaxID=624146 RepID=A0A2T4D075_9GAMM|nr:hypothetical protein C9939_02505 [Pseudidiomarina aestuarii]PTB88255.1 hypothetical protein C9928_06695 [Pseudidiomarina aestuarii]
MTYVPILSLLQNISKRQAALLGLLFITYAAVWIDTAYGILSFLGLGALKISMLYRLVLTATLLVLMFVYQSFLAWYMKLMMLFWALLLWALTWPVGDVELVNQINHILRLLFPFGMAIITFELLRVNHSLQSLTLKGIGHYGWVVGCFLILSAVTGLGLESYGDHAFGIKSFYIAGNDTGLATLIALCCLFCVLYYQPSLTTFMAILLCIAGLILMGTKAGWAGTFVIVMVYLTIFLLFKKSHGAVGLSLKSIAVVGVFSGLTIASILLVQNYDRVRFQVEQFQALAEGENPRAELIQSAERHLMDYPGRLALVGNADRFDAGVGERYYVTFNNIKGTNTNKLVEQDWYDLRGHYGTPFALYVTLGHLAFLLLAVKLFLRKPSVFNMTLAFSLFMFMGHGMLAGHAFFSGQAGGLAGIVYGILLIRMRRVS